MMFFRDYFRAFVPLVLVFTAYHGIVVPWLEPNVVRQERTWQASALPNHVDWWEELFPEGAWQRNSPRVIKTENAILLFQTKEQKTDTRWHVKPLTILIPQESNSKAKRAIFINNQNGAEIQFKDKVDWSKELPPVVSGQLLGDISIYSPPDDATQDNGMLIEASDIRIDKRQIWTLQEVRMKMGNSFVKGRDLAIYLDKDLLTNDTTTTKVESPFNGLDHLRLVYVDQVNIGLTPGGLWPSKNIPDIERRPAHANLKCGGSFEFYFHQSQARLRDGVLMEHIVQGLPVDTFECNELVLQVGWNSKEANSAQNASKTGDDWRIDRLEAFGALGRDNRDYSRWLKLKAPGMQAEAEGQHLHMDFVNGIVSLTNKLPGTTSKDTRPVYLRRESIQLWSPEVQYQNTETITNNTEPTSKSSEHRLGAILASGPGQAQIDNEGESWKISWGERLLVRPDQDKDLMIITGSANVSNPDQGRFIAEELRLWLTPMSKELAVQMAPRYPDGNIPQMLPDRMEAAGEVVVDSPQLRARVESMQVWFAYPVIVSPEPTSNPTNQIGDSSPTAKANNLLVATSNSTSIPQPGSLALGPATDHPIPSPPLTQPKYTINHPKSTRALSSPLTVTGKTLQAHVLSLGKQTLIDDLNLDGNFTLTKDQVSDDSPWPFTATGEQLHLTQGKAETTDITILGKPAKVAVGSGWVVAPELKLLQSENQFWIDHPGELVIPVEAMQSMSSKPGANNSLVAIPSFAPNGANGFQTNLHSTASDQVRWHEPPRIQWGDRMTFDGRTARFGGGVAISCRMETDEQTLWHISARARQLAVEMESPVALRSMTPGSQAPKAQVGVVRLIDNVDIRAVQTDLKLNRRSLEHIQVPQLDIMVPSQTWLGHGPGEMWSRRLGNSNPLNGQSASGDSLQCVHLSFLGRVEGDMSQRKATFYDRIEALMGPIANWDDIVNVHKVDRLARNQTRLISDQLNVFDASGLSWNQVPESQRSSSRNTAWEIEAISRVSMQSNTEQGELSIASDRLAYAALQDVVRVQGSPRQSAVISLMDPKTQRQQEVRVSVASLRLKTGELSMDIGKIEGTLPPNFQPPNASPTNPQPMPPPTAPNSSIPSPRDFNPFQPRRP